MKNRSGFVSNSSSTSFICAPNVTLTQATDVMKCIEDFIRTVNQKGVATIPFDGNSYQLYKISTESDENYLLKYCGLNEKGYKEGDLMGRIVVCDAQSNSIPYPISDLFYKLLGIVEEV